MEDECDGLSQQLQDSLRVEAASREHAREPYATLLKEYQETRKQLAEARLHIDRLRFGSNFTVNHYLELLYTQSQRNQNSLSHGYPSRVNSCCSLPRPAQCTSTVEGVHPVADGLAAATASSTQFSLLNGTLLNGMEDKPSQLHRQPQEREHSLDRLDHSQKEYLGRIRRLQEQVAAVADGIHDRNASLDETCARVSHMQQQHLQLAEDLHRLLHEGGERGGNDDENGEADGRERQLLQSEVSA